MNITASMVKALRDKTGAGMMDCKKALTECDADVEKAVDWLRQKGLAKAAKRADRETSEGVIASWMSEDQKSAVMVEVKCETDFVARGDKFRSFASEVVKVIADTKPATLEGEPFTAMLGETVAATGENVTLGKFVRYDIEGAGLVGAYIHANGKIASMIEVKCDSEAAAASEEVKACAKNIAMQIAATNPLALDASSLDPALMEREREVYRQKAREDGKPEQIIEKIAEGAVKKYCKEVCLLDQPYIREEKQSISDLLKATGKAAGCTLSLGSFCRIHLDA